VGQALLRRPPRPPLEQTSGAENPAQAGGLPRLPHKIS